jgi:hypothetical protein
MTNQQQEQRMQQLSCWNTKHSCCSNFHHLGCLLVQASS